MIDYSKIKLVIWDLDDTFWNGTLSEGEVSSIERNCRLVQKLTERGIINTVCSKNDLAPVIDKLKEFNIFDYFVFLSVDWTPKGNRIANLLTDMGLRAANTLFLDDNIANLNEAKYYSPDLLVGEPSEIDSLSEYVDSLPISDPNCTRLCQYRILEQKQRAKVVYNDNLSFLYASNTRVQILHDCVAVFDRIYELIQRTNQLNFTKNRCKKEELSALINDKRVRCGYVTAKDNFGDYGIVGFYALRDNTLIHFLFSCRTIGQGVEQWVYSTLGCPELSVVEPVVNHVEMSEAPLWINQNITENACDAPGKRCVEKIVFKGPCDLEILSSYLKSANIIREFTYVADGHKSVEHHNHSTNYLKFHFLNEDERTRLLQECIFNDKDMFQTQMYDNDTSLVFLSTLVEANLGIYRRKDDGCCIAWGEWVYPLTDERNWQLYVEDKIYTGGNKFTIKGLKEFSTKYEFIGRLSPSQVFDNIQELLRLLPQDTHVCLLLGSEVPHLKNTAVAYDKREEYYKELNEYLRGFASSNSRLHLIDFNDYITSQADFTNNINHFQRRVYFEASKQANEVIEVVVGAKMEEIGILGRMLVALRSFLVSSLGHVKILVKVVRLFKSAIRSK